MAILDRNSHVREFLCREFEGHGFAPTALRDAAELAASLDSALPPEVVVLDPEAFGLTGDLAGDLAGDLTGRLGGQLALRLAGLAARVPLVLHVFPEAGIPAGGFGATGALVVEKQADTRELNHAVWAALAAWGARSADRKGEGA